MELIALKKKINEKFVHLSVKAITKGNVTYKQEKKNVTWSTSLLSHLP
jgi:hypothetical protein